MPERVPASLLAALADLSRWLDDVRAPGMVIGGVAASILGRPRLTQDVDALVLLPESDWTSFLASAEQYHLAPRISDPLAFARRSRMLLLRHLPSTIDVDVAFGGLTFEQEAMERSGTHEVGGISLRLPRVEDLMVMKGFAHRPKDLEDLRGLLDAHPNADIEFVRQWLREFSAALTSPDILNDFEKLLAPPDEVGERPSP